MVIYKHYINIKCVININLLFLWYKRVVSKLTTLIIELTNQYLLVILKFWKVMQFLFQSLEISDRYNKGTFLDLCLICKQIVKQLFIYLFSDQTLKRCQSGNRKPLKTRSRQSKHLLQILDVHTPWHGIQQHKYNQL